MKNISVNSCVDTGFYHECVEGNNYSSILSNRHAVYLLCKYTKLCQMV